MQFSYVSILRHRMPGEYRLLRQPLQPARSATAPRVYRSVRAWLKAHRKAHNTVCGRDFCGVLQGPGSLTGENRGPTKQHQPELITAGGRYGDADMSETDTSPDDPRPRARGSVRAYWRVAGGYWTGPTAFEAWALTTVSLVLIIGNIAVQYGINLWNRSFFNALERHDSSFV